MEQKIAGKNFSSLKNVLASPWLYRIVRFGLAVLFIYAGVSKLLDPKAFARLVSAYSIVPEAVLPVVAIGLPLLEVVAGIGLLLDIRGSLAIISGLLGLFIFVLGFGILKNLNIDCGCFGTEELAQQNTLRQALYRDLVLIGIIIPFLYMSRWARQYSRHKQ
ncbi:MAG TPA: MauE/DoxX family redox-associated membrane protein [Syntrophales bacterium]|nr:MauE/DoxX family redox-associated membrane protein [Syntrophales bacterium]